VIFASGPAATPIIRDLCIQTDWPRHSSVIPTNCAPPPTPSVASDLRHRHPILGRDPDHRDHPSLASPLPSVILRAAQFCVVRKLDTLNHVTVVENQPVGAGPAAEAARAAEAAPAGAGAEADPAWAGAGSGEPDGRSGETEGLRERKKAATRRALGLAAMRLAIDRGLDNVHPDDIAAEAGVSTRTFNNYFASKYEAICALAMERGTIIGTALRSRPATEPLMEAITVAVLEPYSSGGRPPDRDWVQSVRLVIKSASLEGEYLRTQRATQKALAEAIADRIGCDPAVEMFPAVMAGAVTAAVHVAHERWLSAEPPVALAPLIRQALSQLNCLCSNTPRANSLAVGPEATDPDQALRPTPT
jgi:AcrR family transcriptional regulator